MPPRTSQEEFFKDLSNVRKLKASETSFSPLSIFMFIIAACVFYFIREGTYTISDPIKYYLPLEGITFILLMLLLGYAYFPKLQNFDVPVDQDVLKKILGIKRANEVLSRVHQFSSDNVNAKRDTGHNIGGGQLLRAKASYDQDSSGEFNLYPALSPSKYLERLRGPRSDYNSTERSSSPRKVYRGGNESPPRRHGGSSSFQSSTRGTSVAASIRSGHSRHRADSGGHDTVHTGHSGGSVLYGSGGVSSPSLGHGSVYASPTKKYTTSPGGGISSPLKLAGGVTSNNSELASY